MDKIYIVNLLKQRRYFAYGTHQLGQAMVEFAIIALLLILLIAGGIELGIAAFNSNRTSEGAKTASNDWINILGNGAMYRELGSSGVYGFELGSSGAYGFEPSYQGLGNHYDLTAFSRPSCNQDGSYEDGLPPKEDSDLGLKFVYLYNPLPIDITECTGNDALEPTRSRISVLITGHSNHIKENNPGNPILHDGLPSIHQAIYSQYEKTCVDIANNSYMTCGKINTSNPDHRILLKLPGVLADGNGMDIGPTYSEAMSRLAKIAHDPDSGSFILDEANPDQNIALYPTFHIQCSPAKTNEFGDLRVPEETCDSYDDPAGICWYSDDESNIYALGCNVRIMTRYRHTFETFIGMTMAEANEPEMTPVSNNIRGFFDYDDGNPGTLGNGLQLGYAPKPYRDFLGCYRTTALAPENIGEFLTSFNIISCN